MPMRHRRPYIRMQQTASVLHQKGDAIAWQAHSSRRHSQYPTTPPQAKAKTKQAATVACGHRRSRKEVGDIVSETKTALPESYEGYKRCGSGNHPLFDISKHGQETRLRLRFNLKLMTRQRGRY